MAGGGLFGSPDSIERLAHALCGPKGNGGTTNVVREVRDQASHIANDLVPNEWRGPAAGAFLQMLSHRDVPDLTALSEATSALGAPLIQLALDIRAANRLADDAKEL